MDVVEAKKRRLPKDFESNDEIKKRKMAEMSVDIHIEKIVGQINNHINAFSSYVSSNFDIWEECDKFSFKLENHGKKFVGIKYNTAQNGLSLYKSMLHQFNVEFPDEETALKFRSTIQLSILKANAAGLNEHQLKYFLNYQKAKVLEEFSKDETCSTNDYIFTAANVCKYNVIVLGENETELVSWNPNYTDLMMLKRFGLYFESVLMISEEDREPFIEYIKKAVKKLIENSANNSSVAGNEIDIFNNELDIADADNNIEGTDAEQSDDSKLEIELLCLYLRTDMPLKSGQVAQFYPLLSKYPNKRRNSIYFDQNDSSLPYVCVLDISSNLVQIFCPSFKKRMKVSSGVSEYLNKEYGECQYEFIEPKSYNKKRDWAPVFALAYLITACLDNDPAQYELLMNIFMLRNHLAKILEEQKLTLFPQSIRHLEDRTAIEQMQLTTICKHIRMENFYLRDIQYI